MLRHQLTQENFPKIVQEIIEHYLIPFGVLAPGEKEKENLQDGYIEREVHGGSDAALATIWALAMHRLLLELTPNYVNTALERIARYLGTDTHSVLLFILTTTAYHDAGREGEAEDIWEKESAQYANLKLGSLGVKNKSKRQIFSAAIKHKDHREKYLDKLKKIGIDEQDQPYFDYIRLLINLGDNLEITRCTPRFIVAMFLKTLSDIPGFDKAKHKPRIMSIIVAVLQFNHDHHNLITDCSIVDEDGEVVAEQKCSTSSVEKVKYEHAENVFAVLFHEALKYPAFQPLLQGFAVPTAALYTGPARVNPLVHGCNSSALVHLPQTDFCVMSPHEMMDDFLAAPMSGEMDDGGYNWVGSTDDKSFGKTSFGRMILDDPKSGHYSLGNIWSKYTRFSVATKESSRASFRETLETGFSILFSNINLMLVYLTRARQTHASLDELISKEEIGKLREDIELVMQFFFFVRLLGVHIHLDKEAMKAAAKDYSGGIDGDKVSAITSYFSLKYLLDKIKENKIDMRHIWQNPSEENLKKVLAILTLSPELQEEYGQRPFFSLAPFEKDERLFFSFNAGQYYKYLSMNDHNHQIKNLFYQFYFGVISAQHILDVSKCAGSMLEAFEARVKTLNKILEAPQEAFTLNEMQKSLLEKPFRMVLVTENEKNMYRMSLGGEYRSMVRLKIGKDIKTIAVEHEAQCLRLMKFLALHGLQHVQVLTIGELALWSKTKVKPKICYHHTDGMPTLKWLSAVKVSELGLFQQPYLASVQSFSQEIKKNAEACVYLADYYNAVTFSSVK